MPLLGGVIIGIAVSLMLVLNGRVTGISGILGSALSPQRGDFLWRLAFILGLISGGGVLTIFNPESFSGSNIQATMRLIIAGLLVGFGTLMGSGCTSGHAVCGLSRLSPRSIIATILFMLFGFVTVGVLGR